MSLRCLVQPLHELPRCDMDAIASSLCWPGSDFHEKLTRGGELGLIDGTISVVSDGGIIGWARSEMWMDSTGLTWPTLEAFVHKNRRRNGIAVFATCGLAVGVFAEEGLACAVFSPPMLGVAVKAGLHPTLFSKDSRGAWTREH